MALSRKVIKQAKDFVALGYKVYHFRRDRMSEKQAQTLRDKLAAMTVALKKRDEEDDAMRARMDTLHPLLSKVGGRIYPRTFWNDNVEMLLVAAIVVLGIRAFIVQPFIIPTNSMYPSYAGVTHKLYATEAAPPGIVAKTRNLILRGARNRTVIAPVSGELILPYFEHQREIPPGGSGSIRYREAPGRILGFWPTRVREYEMLIGRNGETVTLRVPHSFRIDEVIAERIRTSGNPNGAAHIHLRGRHYFATGIHVEAGEPLLSFDIQLGDMLFVERMSYHFRKPRVGEPFVFRTGNIPGLVDAFGNPEDKYYIKRLVGQPGDMLRITPPVLYRNDAPIEGVRAFEKNNRQEAGFPGYVHSDPVAYANRRGIPIPPGSMQDGQSVPIPEGFFYALGDNSPDSLDSRAWGYVPERDVIGKALFIYYPFTSRWGPGR